MPNRILKDRICKSKSISKLTWFEEVLFYRLIVSCDDYGRFDADPLIIKNICFPRKPNLTVQDVDVALRRLSAEGMIIVYERDGDIILQLCNWKSYQKIRAKESKYPEFDSTCTQMYADDSTCTQMFPYSYSYSDSYSNAEAEANARASAAAATKPIYQHYEQNIGPINPTIAEAIKSWSEVMQAEVICAAISEAAKNHARWRYADAILRDCHNSNVHTLEAWEARQKQRESAHGAVRAKREPQPAESHTYTLDEIKRLEAEWSGEKPD